MSNSKDLQIEGTKMWGLKTMIIPVVIGALGMTKIGIENYVSKIPGYTRASQSYKKYIVRNCTQQQNALAIYEACQIFVSQR